MIIRYLFKIMIGFIVILSSVTVSAQNSVLLGNSTYKLSSGDIIRVIVFGESDLSIQQTRLSDAGTFSYPFIGEVKAQGKTASELERILISELEDDFLVDPRVSVSVIEYREFYISGEVNSPGGYKYQPGLNLRRAIALAGGLTERASTKRITVMKDLDPDRKPKRVS